MRDYLVIETDPGGDEAEWRAAEAQLLASGAWKKVAERRWFSVFLEAAHPPAYRHLPSVAGALIGDVFDAAAARQGRGQGLELAGFGGEPELIAHRLIDRAFGRYVAILNDDRGPARVLRDPLGAMDAVGWRRCGLRFIGSRLPDQHELWPDELDIDFPGLARILRQKNLASLVCPLVGITSFPSGVLAGPDGRGARLWSPAWSARSRDKDSEPAALRAVVDGTIAAWALGRQGAFCEISGGLDSAIVASGLAKAGAPIVYGVNHSFPRPESDERVYAQAVADRAGLALEIVERGPLDITPAKLAAGAWGMRPNYVGGDPDHDLDLARRLSSEGIEAMFTGRGGDGVFYQMPHPALVRDLLRRGCGGGRLAGLASLAGRNTTTVWDVIRKGRGADDLTAGLGLDAFLSETGLSVPAERHPWLTEARDLDPARQLQILTLVNGLSAFGASQRSRAGDVIDPLMSQPVVEFCLATRPALLAVGDNDRPFARAAFRDRLPPEVIERRGKGDLTTYFAQSLRRSLPALRPYLIDGMLAQAGLLDRQRLEAALSPERLVWVNSASEIFVLLALESWARGWRDRLDAWRADGQARGLAAAG